MNWRRLYSLVLRRVIDFLGVLLRRVSELERFLKNRNGLDGQD